MNHSKIENILQNNSCNYIHLNSTTSTMDDAKKYLEKFHSNVVILADEQKNGKGRRGNIWISPPGNIYCSIALNNTIPINEHYLFSMLTAVSVKFTLENFGANEIKFKWPNDIFFKNNKFGGIILETHNSKNNNKYVIIGIGINFASSPSIEDYKTTFIKKFVKINNKLIFLYNFLNNFFFYWRNYNERKKEISSKFYNSLMFLNEKIEINTGNNRSIKGIFKGIKYDGSLILDKDNELVSIYSGNIKI